ncbi:MAG: GNAT family N-acetyltransferase [Ardenticatenales bacterium]
MDTSPVRGLRVVPVTNWGHAETMRFVRNTCRAGFAHDTAKIGRRAQRAWWQANRTRMVAALYYVGDAPAGYGLLRQSEDGRWWSSVAVLPRFGGIGFGRAITQHLVRQSPDGVVWAEARKDQPAACALHRADDWEVIGEDAERWHYRTRPDIGERRPWLEAGS